MSGFQNLLALAHGVRSEEGVGPLELYSSLVEARKDPSRPHLGDFLGVLDGAIELARALPACPPEASGELRHHVLELVRLLDRVVAGEFEPEPEAAPGTPEPVEEEPEEAVAVEESAYRAVEEENAVVLGEILAQLGLVSQEEVALALSAQDTTGKRMGEILIETGMIGVGDLKTALNLQQHLARNTLVEARSGKLIDEWHLGRILVRSGSIDEATLEKALELQSRSGLRIGEALVELGAVTWDHVTEAVRIQKQERRRSPGPARG